MEELTDVTMPHANVRSSAKIDSDDKSALREFADLCLTQEGLHF